MIQMTGVPADQSIGLFLSLSHPLFDIVGRVTDSILSTSVMSLAPRIQPSALSTCFCTCHQCASTRLAAFELAVLPRTLRKMSCFQVLPSLNASRCPWFDFQNSPSHAISSASSTTLLRIDGTTVAYISYVPMISTAVDSFTPISYAYQTSTLICSSIRRSHPNTVKDTVKQIKQNTKSSSLSQRRCDNDS